MRSLRNFDGANVKLSIFKTMILQQFKVVLFCLLLLLHVLVNFKQFSFTIMFELAKKIADVIVIKFNTMLKNTNYKLDNKLCLF